ncbi:MAG: extracellular solute-binding protein [Spirochaetaceae bacterium]|nr:extracellular solute-binding protein [Spirochaetaceae bacterium]
MKKFIIVIAVLALSFALFANGSDEGAASGPAFDPNKAYTISIGAYGELEVAYKAVMETPEWKEAFPNVTVEFQSADFGGHHNRLTTVLAAGDATNDIEALEIGFIAKFVEGGGLTDLTSFGAGVADDLAEFAVSNATTPDGRLVALPVDVAPAVIFYRKSLIDEAGVDMTNLDSWADYIEAGKKLTKDLDGDGTMDQYLVPSPGDVAMMPLNGGKGGWIDADGNALQPKEKFIAALELVRDIRAAGVDADLGAWSGPWVESFKNGTVATQVSGAWFGGALKAWMAPDLAGDWRVAPLPGGLYASMGGSYLAIPESVPMEQKAVAWEVMKFLCTNEAAQIASFKAIDAFPALKTLYTNPIMDEPVDYFGGQKVRQIYADIALNVPVNQVSADDPLVSSIFGNALTEVQANGVDVEEAYANAVAEITAVTE